MLLAGYFVSLARNNLFESWDGEQTGFWERRKGGGGGGKNVPEFIAGPLNSVHLVDTCVIKVAQLQKWPVCGVCGVCVPFLMPRGEKKNESGMIYCSGYSSGPC